MINEDYFSFFFFFGGGVLIFLKSLLFLQLSTDFMSFWTSSVILIWSDIEAGTNSCVFNVDTKLRPEVIRKVIKVKNRVRPMMKHCGTPAFV